MTGSSQAIVSDKKRTIGKDPAPHLCNTVWALEWLQFGRPLIDMAETQQ